MSIRLSALRTIAPLASMRIVSLTLMLMQNVLVVRFLSLEEIGRYYLIATIANLGNAVFFYSADLHLQRQLAELSLRPAIDARSLGRYFAATGAAGLSLVLLAAGGYFAFGLHAGDAARLAIVCAVLSLVTYLSNAGRNLLQLAARPKASSTGPIVEGSVRVLALLVLGLAGSADAVTVAIASAAGSLLSAAVGFALLTRLCDTVTASYHVAPRKLARLIVPVGSSGLLNWAQLQGYRPVLAGQPGLTQVIGVVSFMSTLGSSAANAAFTILNQFQVPRQYGSGGATTPRFLMTLGALSLALMAVSLPAALAFLWLTDRMALVNLVYSRRLAGFEPGGRSHRR